MGIGKEIKKLVGKSKKTKHQNGVECPPTPEGSGSHHSHPSDDTRHSEAGLRNIEAVSVIDSSIYSPRSFHETAQIMQPNARISWLDGIPNNPYGYTVHLSQPTSHKSPSNELERAKSYQGSLRKSRPQSIYCNTFQSSPPQQRARPVSYVVYAFAKTRYPDILEAMDRDETAIEETKQEIRQIKIQDVESTRNTLRLAYQAFEIGTGTLRTLRAQGDRLHKAEVRLDQATDASADATLKIGELENADKMLDMSNPFTAARRERKGNVELLASRLRYREARDNVRLNMWHQWKLREVRHFVNVPLPAGDTGRDLHARAKYQFDPDSEDERLEDEIQDGQSELLHVLRDLKEVALVQRGGLDGHSVDISRIEGKANKVDDDLAKNQARLNSVR